MERMKTLAFVSVLAMVCQLAPAAVRTIESRRLHLGTAGDPEYDIFAAKPVDGRRLDLKFNATPNRSEATLFLWQDDVKQDWVVELNGKKIGTLFLMEAPLIHSLRVPPGALREGENVLSIVPPKAIDNIFVGDIRLDDRPAAVAINQATLEIQVVDPDKKVGLPCRLTVVDEKGVLVPLYAEPSPNVAVRPGVAYTGNGQARLGVMPGTYTVYATRGFEYSLRSNVVTIAADGSKLLRFNLEREVQTRGFVSSDTHVHTFSLSKHGDATLQERAVTLAGEGIELPVATDHNILSDYEPAAVQAGVRAWFTPVIGDEVTTKTAHFNVFPIRPGSRVPNEKRPTWTELFLEMRSTPGAEVIILNHPLNVHNGFQPFAPTNFNRVTGEKLQTLEYNFDAMELVNSSALQSEMMGVFEGWFALLNAGHKITAVGSSDGHDVSRYIVGQGRTYIACPDKRPDRIDIEKACRNLKEGRALVSMGLLADLTVNGKYEVGDFATRLGKEYEVTVTVQGPSWVTADKVELFANGVKIREQKIVPSSRVEKARVTWKLPRPQFDHYLVALATGPGVTAPYWAISRPYQPTSKKWNPQVVGATNPIWIDGDGDAKFTSARDYALPLVLRNLSKPAQLFRELGAYDQAVAAQAAGLWQKGGNDLRKPAVQELLSRAPNHVQKGVTAFTRTLSPN